ncbi:type II toxin-antitoxin system VapC family toxin [Agromyces archimandritae]|uniref:Ribonuclease VapC n=1 Tax=Agromyces archimandritae TaxID=2781962 RepID=A0A975FPM4_9MICO|nr:type II toxin-antitoxin system VapC family toxin [Agromyces archimandritae]QTX05353.1 type II toxin-antitoxin system VapC family toxin [Agromyces archimandritae]
MTVVADCSAVVQWLTGHGAPPEEPIAAPALLDYEVASVLRRLAAAGAVPPNEAREALERFRELEIDRHPADPFLERMWILRHRLTAYDAAYAALAEALDATLITDDRGLASVAGETCRVAAP